MKKKHRSPKRASNISQEKFQPLKANVKVIGVGGGGSNSISRMAKDFIRGVDFIAINTDHQDLDQAAVKHKLYIGKSLTRGLGTGMNPDLGRQAAEENRSEIAEAVEGADLVFISAGLGGGTGTGATPIVAEAAKQAGALTIAVVTKPFSFEGAQRERIAAEGLMKLKDKVDAIIVVPNDRIFTVIGKDTAIMKAFEAIDDVLRRALKGLVEIIAMPGIINVDFADVKNIMQDAGVAIVGVGIASGAERAVNAVNLAIHSPLLETSPEGAKAILLGISGGRDLRMTEINEAAKVIAQTADPGARIIFGAYYDRNLKQGQIKVTVVAAGFNGSQPNSLFGAGHYANNRDAAIFSPRMPAIAEPTFAPKKSPPRSGLERDFDEPAKEMNLEETTPSPKFNPHPVSKKDKEAPGSASAKDKNAKESDPWDIPAFLRRRKK
jgi:cell division protein FtsZ